MTVEHLDRAPAMDEKETLHHYLRVGRYALPDKLDGVSEYDIRRPLTPTCCVWSSMFQAWSWATFGEVFGRPSGRHLPWYDDDASPAAGR